jgi:hypothetical protein
MERLKVNSHLLSQLQTKVHNLKTLSTEITTSNGDGDTVHALGQTQQILEVKHYIMHCSTVICFFSKL